MTMDDFLDSFKRKHVKLTLGLGTFIGVVLRINQNKTIVLDEVVCLKTGRKFPGVKLFFGHEILNVEFLHVSKSDKSEAGPNSTEGHLTGAEFQPYRKNMRLDDDDNEENYVDFVVIDEFHEKFGPAVMHIRRQQVIGLGADGVGTFQHERLCWLQISTKNRVYLFDILLLGVRAFKNGLSMILEHKHILKVIHDCRSITACLSQFGVSLTNVFDTQVADVMCFYSQSGGLLPDRVSPLQDVVSLHLHVPPSCLSSLRMRAQITQEDSEVWYVRPCPAALLKLMALSVVHLLPLRLVLLDALMAEYTHLVDSYLRANRLEPVHTHNIGTSCVLELPEELRQLEWRRRQRQERALELYHVTEQGLLQRSKPRAQTQPPAPPAQTQPPAPPAQTQPPAPPAQTQPPAPPAQTQPPAPPAQTQPPAPPAQTQPPAPPAQTQPPAPPAPTQPPAPPAQTPPHSPAPPAQTPPHTPAPPAQTPPHTPAPPAPMDNLQPRDIRTSPDLNPAPPDLDIRQILRKQLSTATPVAPSGGLGLMEIVLDTMGRGRPLHSLASPSLPAFPALGRGLYLQAQIPTECPEGAHKTPFSPGKVTGASPGLKSNLVPCAPQGGLVQPPVSRTLPRDVPAVGRGLYLY